ncbi:MAG TPA: hypothetical protein VFH59_17720 [Frateuria sp.]|uniref:hypothetical protein n=1 Tax=Frateuria sp. TaxID=2211372 RepID=UPI002D7FBE09|nr:hypothetical protein [Frateuria sp.]HET6807277.1 hypothetical protein [Frateuria sp.]
MQIQVAIAAGLALAFESADTYACERMFQAVRTLPLPGFADELQGYVDQVLAAAQLPAAA